MNTHTPQQKDNGADAEREAIYHESEAFEKYWAEHQECPEHSLTTKNCASATWHARAKIARAAAPAVAQPERSDAPAVVTIPNGVYYADYADNFYCMMSKRGMGRDFYSKWSSLKEQFPTEAFRALAAPSQQPTDSTAPSGDEVVK